MQHDRYSFLLYSLHLDAHNFGDMAMAIWKLFIDVVVALAAIAAILQFFGITPASLRGGIVMPISRRWKLGLMLATVALSLGLSGYGFYRSLRPKIVEKTVEKITEKPVPIPCPKAEEPAKPKPPAKPTTKPPKQSSNAAGSTSNAPGSVGAPSAGSVTLPLGTTISATTNAPDSAAVGVNTGTITVNPKSTAKVRAVLYGAANRAAQFHELKLFDSMFQIQVTGANVPMLSVTASHKSLIRIGCNELKPGTLWTNSEGHNAQNGSGSCFLRMHLELTPCWLT